MTAAAAFVTAHHPPRVGATRRSITGIGLQNRYPFVTKS